VGVFDRIWCLHLQGQSDYGENAARLFKQDDGEGVHLETQQEKRKNSPVVQANKINET
jgi:hypothetical protein